MGRFAVVLLCFCFAAQRSLAHVCESVDKLDTTVLARTFENGAESIPAPSLEWNDMNGTNFQITFAQVISHYGRSLILNVHRQMIVQGKALIDDINELAAELRTSTEILRTNPGYNGAYDFENAMNRVVMLFQTVLSLSPGPGRPVQPPLPPLPVPTNKVHPINHPLSLQRLFVNYNDTLNEITTNVWAFAGAIILAGWNSVWSYYDIYGQQTRNEILNDKVLDVYRQVALVINTEYGFIGGIVNSALWESYTDAAARIEAAWNAYQVYKSQVTCLAIVPY